MARCVSTTGLLFCHAAHMRHPWEWRSYIATSVSLYDRTYQVQILGKIPKTIDFKWKPPHGTVPFCRWSFSSQVCFIPVMKRDHSAMLSRRSCWGDPWHWLKYCNVQKFFPNVGQSKAGATVTVVTVTDPKFRFGKRFASASSAGLAVSRHGLWRARFLQRLPLGVRGWCCRTSPKRSETHGPSICVFSRCRWSNESEGRQEIMEMEKDDERWIKLGKHERYGEMMTDG